MSGLADRTLPGALAEAFTIGDVIGRGATSIVYAATSRRGQHGALKVVFRQARSSMRRRDNRPAPASPRVVEIYERGTMLGPALVDYVFMERLQGEALRARLRHGPLPWRVALQTARELAEGLQALHRLGVCHGDVKPDNVIATAGGAVLVDLDHLGLIADEEAATGAGTPAYMAPEQATSTRATAAADIYALGCVLFEMLTGTPPFRGNGLALAVEHECTPLPVHHLPPTVPAAVAEVLERLCAKEPRRRPSAAEAMAGLARCLRPAPSRARRAAWATIALAGAVAALLGMPQRLVPTTVAAPQAVQASPWTDILAAHVTPPRWAMVAGDDLQLTLSASAGVITLDIADDAGLPVPLREIVVAVADDDATPVIFTAQVVRPGRWQVRVPSALAIVRIAVYLPDRDTSLRVAL